ILVDPVAPLEAGLRLRGAFNRANALLAAAAARALGVDEDAIVRGLESVDGVPGRFEEVDEGQPFTVLVDYAHKPGSLESVLAAARGIAAGRVICVFGCGGDLVVIAGKGHEQGQEIAGELLPFDDRDVAREVLRRLGAPA